MNVDLLIRGGRVVDGTAAGVEFAADVAVVDGRITAVGALANVGAEQVIDAAGRVVAPGFIDAHVHSEGILVDGPDVDRFGSLLQGVTTHLLGPDGWGLAPLAAGPADELWEAYRYVYPSAWLRRAWPSPAEYLAAYEGRTPVNLVPQVPHMAVRQAVAGWAPRPLDDDELEHACLLTQAWLEAGAVALNAGLDYEPSTASTSEELVALASIVADAGGIFAAHLRYQRLGRAAAWQEAIDVGRRARIPVSVSHETVDDETEPLLAEAARDLEISFDTYLYPAGAGHLLYALPEPDRVGGAAGVLARLAEPAERGRIAAIYEHALAGDAAERAVIASTRSGEWAGQSLAAAAAATGDPVGVFVVRLLRAELPDVQMTYHRPLSGDAWAAIEARTAGHPAMRIASDGIYHGQVPHRRGYGAYARFLRVAVRERGLLSLGQAIHRMSGAVADTYRLRDRGRVAPGFAADLVIFDPATVADGSTWTEPRLPPLGIEAVVVNGRLAVEGGRPTGVLAGQVVRRA